MAVKKKRSVKRPARAGAPQTQTTDISDEDSENESEEEVFDDEEVAPLDVVTKRLVAPRAQGIVKTVASGIDEMAIISFYARSGGGAEELVCTVNTTDIDNDIATITVEAHEWAEAIANGLWEEIECDAVDPNTVSVTTEGWACTYSMNLQ